MDVLVNFTLKLLFLILIAILGLIVGSLPIVFEQIKKLLGEEDSPEQ